MTTLQNLEERLREWPRGLAPEMQPLVREALLACTSMFGASGAVLAWEEGDEPGLTIAAVTRGEFSWHELQQEQFLPLVADELEELAFYDPGTSLVLTLEGQQRVLEAIHPELRHAFGLERTLTFPIRGETVTGRTFIVSPEECGENALRFTEVVALLLESRMDAVGFCRSAAREAVAAELIKVSRDLHDGLLQSFTGIVLQLETVHATLVEDAESARRMLTEIQASIMSDQRDLRSYVENLRPRRRRGEMTFDFYSRLEEMRRRFASQWGLRVTVDATNLDTLVSQALGQETFRLVQEAVTNSAKHGRAAHVDVRLRTGEGALLIDVSDDGVGLPMRGRLTLEDMREKSIGPSMLAERVASLNGDMTVDSGEGGLHLSMVIPLGWSGA